MNTPESWFLYDPNNRQTWPNDGQLIVFKSANEGKTITFDQCAAYPEGEWRPTQAYTPPEPANLESELKAAYRNLALLQDREADHCKLIEEQTSQLSAVQKELEATGKALERTILERDELGANYSTVQKVARELKDLETIFDVPVRKYLMTQFPAAQGHIPLSVWLVRLEKSIQSAKEAGI